MNLIVCVHACQESFVPFYSHSVPATAPGNVSVISVSSSSLTFSWDPLPVEHQNGIIRHYSIAVTEEDTGMLLLKTTAMESITLNNLHPFYTYSVQVSASTIDDGPPSPPALVKTSEDGMKHISEPLAHKYTVFDSHILCIFLLSSI